MFNTKYIKIILFDKFAIIIFYLMIINNLQLDVKEAPEPLTEHPQWDISDEEDDTKEEDKQSDISEFTTDEDVED